MFEVYSQKETTRFSKPFRVDKGKVVVISSFNFACEKLNDIGEVVRKADCAVLHKIELKGNVLPQGDGCIACSGCIIENLDVSVLTSEPVAQCGASWTHNAQTNLTVLSVPGFYMFEVCSDDAVGSVSIQVEELSVAEAALLPKPLFHGEC